MFKAHCKNVLQTLNNYHKSFSNEKTFFHKGAMFTIFIGYYNSYKIIVSFKL